MKRQNKARKLLKTDRLVSLGTEARPKCKGCSRPIKKGHEVYLPDGIYGSGCAERKLDRINNGQALGGQEYAL